MSIASKDRQRFYRILEKNPKGNRDELKEKVGLSNDFTFNELYRESGSVGIIKNGVDGSFQKRYSLTELGKEQIESYLYVYDF